MITWSRICNPMPADAVTRKIYSRLAAVAINLSRQVREGGGIGRRRNNFNCLQQVPVISVRRAVHNRFIKAAVRSSLIGCHDWLAAIEIALFVRRKKETIKKEKKKNSAHIYIHIYTHTDAFWHYMSVSPFNHFYYGDEQRQSRSPLPRARLSSWKKILPNAIELLIATV